MPRAPPGVEPGEFVPMSLSSRARCASTSETLPGVLTPLWKLCSPSLPRSPVERPPAWPCWRRPMSAAGGEFMGPRSSSKRSSRLASSSSMVPVADSARAETESWAAAMETRGWALFSFLGCVVVAEEEEEEAVAAAAASAAEEEEEEEDDDDDEEEEDEKGGETTVLF